MIKEEVITLNGVEQELSSHPDAGTMQYRKSKANPGYGKDEFIGVKKGHARKVRAMWNRLNLGAKDQSTVDLSSSRRILGMNRQR